MGIGAGIIILAWLGISAMLIFVTRHMISTLALTDTDDAMRLLQVRDWLAGQDFGDVRQYRMMPHNGGADMHWSRLVDMPIAAVVLLLQPLTGVAVAERVAATLIPLLTLLVAALLAARSGARLGGRSAGMLAGLFTLTASAFLTAVSPMRIDHHGWQVVLLLAALAALLPLHEETRRGLYHGVAAGLSICLSIAVGLETLPFLALLLASVLLWWAVTGQGRMTVFVTFATTALLLPVFETFLGVQGPGGIMCDILSPAYVLLGGLAAGLAALVTGFGARWAVWFRLAALGGGMAAIYALFVSQYPQCALGPVSTIDPRLSPWLSQVGEARSFIAAFPHEPAIAVQMLAVPIFGTLAAAWLLLFRPAPSFPSLALLILNLLAAVMVAAVQLRIGIIGAPLAMIPMAAVAAQLLPKVRAQPRPLARTAATALLLIGCSTIGASMLGGAIARAVTVPPANPAQGQASTISCLEGETLRSLDRLDPAMIAAPIDVAPRILLWTHHSSSIGPYHRNVDAILTSTELWTSPPPAGRQALQAMSADYLIHCPGMPEINAARARKDGLAAALEGKNPPPWLKPVMKTESYTLYRII